MDLFFCMLYFKADVKINFRLFTFYGGICTIKSKWAYDIVFRLCRNMMKKLLCMILAVSMGVGILPVTAMAAEETDYYTDTVEIEDTEEQDILESFEETEVVVEDMEHDQQELAEEETLQVQTIEGEYIYHPFSLVTIDLSFCKTDSYSFQ